MPSETAKASLGYVTAYGAAKRGGYLGTYEEWCALMAEVADHLEQNESLYADTTTAKEAAEAAQGYAEVAQGKAEDAQTAAETAQGKAEDAQTAAETAQGKAEDAEDAAEAWAAGTSGGTPSATNNASHYAGQASDSATASAASAASAEAWATGGSGGTASASNNAKYYSEQAATSATAAAAVGTNFAPTFSSSTAYSAGDYVMYNGTQYRFTANHAAGAWTGSDAVAEPISPVVAALKTQLTQNAYFASNVWANKGINDSTGVIGSANPKRLVTEAYVFNKYTSATVTNVYSIIAYGYSDALVSSYLGAYQNGTFVKSGLVWQTGGIDLLKMRKAGAKYIRLFLKKNDNTDITQADGENVALDIDTVFETANGLSEVQESFPNTIKADVTILNISDNEVRKVVTDINKAKLGYDSINIGWRPFTNYSTNGFVDSDSYIAIGPLDPGNYHFGITDSTLQIFTTPYTSDTQSGGSSSASHNSSYNNVFSNAIVVTARYATGEKLTPATMKNLVDSITIEMYTSNQTWVKKVTNDSAYTDSMFKSVNVAPVFSYNTSKLLKSSTMPSGSYKIEISDGENYSYAIYNASNDTKEWDFRYASLEAYLQYDFYLILRRRDVTDLLPDEIQSMVDGITITQKAKKSIHDLYRKDDTRNSALIKDLSALNLPTQQLPVDFTFGSGYSDNAVIISNNTLVSQVLEAGSYHIEANLSGYQFNGTYLDGTAVFSNRSNSVDTSPTAPWYIKIGITGFNTTPTVAQLNEMVDGITVSKRSPYLGIPKYNNDLLPKCTIAPATAVDYYNGNDGTIIKLQQSQYVYVYFPTGVNTDGCMGCDLELYISDASLVSSITLKAPGTDFSRSASPVTGWNTYRFAFFEGVLDDWPFTSLSIYVGSTDPSTPATVYLKSLRLERMEKAKILMINDGCSKNYYDNAFLPLKNIGIPTTFAGAWGLVGTENAITRYLTQAEIDELASDPFCEFSFHDWESEPTSTMTAAELMEDNQKCIAYLNQHGLSPRYIWRAAWTGNNAPNAPSCFDFMDGAAGYQNQSSSGGVLFPPKDIYNIPRDALHSLTQSGIDARFAALKKTHHLYVCYTHLIHDSAYNMNPELFAYFLGKCQTAIQEGWLEGTTFSRLMTRYKNGLPL